MKQISSILFLCFICSLLLSSSPIQSQNNLPVEIKLNYQGKPVDLSKGAYLCEGKDSLSLTQIKFYLGKFEFLKHGKCLEIADSSYHLIDASKNSSLTFSLTTTALNDADELRFQLGVDSLTSNSGAMGGDLDPSKGMYWTWQSGYINCKLEGISKLVPGDKKQFEFHLGGYQHEFSNWQELHFAIRNPKKIMLEVELADFFSVLELSQQHHILSPSKKAVELAQLLAKTFSVK